MDILTILILPVQDTVYLSICLWSCKNSLYVLDISPVSNVCIVITFSQSVVCFHLFNLSFEDQSFFILLVYILSVFFPYVIHEFCILFEKMWKIFFCVSFLRTFIIAAWRFRSVMSLQLIVCEFLEGKGHVQFMSVFSIVISCCLVTNSLIFLWPYGV